MGRNNEFNLLSLNVRGIRTFEKRKAVFSWLGDFNIILDHAILINDILIPILDASSKHIYRSFLAKKQTTPTAKEKLSAKYHHLTIDWKRVYLLSFRTTLETKLWEFQFKILNRIVFTNEKLFRFGMAESDKCVFCQTEVESIEHLLFSCKISSVFWKHVLSWLRDNNIIVENLREEDIIVGKFDVGDDFLLVNHILINN